MRIENETLLDFDDVLIQPHETSSLSSRSQVNLKRKFTMPHSGRVLECIPIIASNMSTVGTLETTKKLGEMNCLTALHKYILPEEQMKYKFYHSVFAPINMLDKKETILSKIKYLGMNKDNGIICIDVANGYQEQFVEYIKYVRKEFPNFIILAGNVVTGNMVEILLLAGVDIVKIGTGSGCFISGTKVLTNSGYKNIENVKIGDKVKTYMNIWKKITSTFQRISEKSYKINDIECTPNHKFYVLHNKYKKIVTKENIHEYSEWVRADKLTKDYLLIKLTN